MTRRALVVLAVALLVTACQSATPSSTAPPANGTVPPSAASDPPAPDVPSSGAPLDPALVGLTCADGIVFHPSVLATPGHAETDPDAAADALRAEILPPESGLPRVGWSRVAQLANRVQFVAPNAGGGWSVVGLEIREGRWELSVAGECRLEPAAPAGTSVAEWWLDPAFPPPDASATSLRALLRERACASGEAPVGRVLPPSIASAPASVTVTFLVRLRPGGADCPSNPSLATVVTLPGPLGNRVLLDGGTYPPRDARLAPEP